MRLLIDECVPRKVKFLFADGGHECETVRDAGFSGRPASNDLDDIRPHVLHALVALQSLKPGQMVEIGILG
jgi:hypothetical protein